jgi:fructokinase
MAPWAHSMPPENPFGLADSSAIAWGAGTIVLDIVQAPDRQAWPAAGGTCGNVMAGLAWLGWAAYPMARLGNDPAGRFVAAELARTGVRPEGLQFDATIQTPVIVETLDPPSKGSAHSFSFDCPSCGSSLPAWQPPQSQIPSAAPRLFFFDLYSETILQLAHDAATKGALVVFEPPSIGDPAMFRAALALAHVLKFSNQRLPNLAKDGPTDGPWLVMETQGELGLQLHDRRPGHGNGWVHLPAQPAFEVIDTAGCGDWTTVGLLHGIAQGGRKGFADLSEQRLLESIRFGQALATWNCGFIGATGGLSPRQGTGETVGYCRCGAAGVRGRHTDSSRPEAAER